MTSRDFLCKELSIDFSSLAIRCRKQDIVHKRWIVMLFYRLMGKSYPFIGNVLNTDHSTIEHGVKHAPESCRETARKLYTQFTGQESNLSLLPKRTKWIKIPDYKHCKIIEKEIEY